MTLLIEINGYWSCNFRCPTCPLSKSKPDPTLVEIEKNITFKSLKPVIDDFLSVYPDGRIEVIGGEPLFHFEKFITIVSEIRKHYPSMEIGTVSNCSILQIKDNLEKFASSGISTIACSLNSHIPKIHNVCRGLRENDDNCEFIMSLPNKLKKYNVNSSISVVPIPENLGHLKEFIQIGYDKGFKNISLCFNLSIREYIDKVKLIAFYFWAKSQTGAIRNYIYNNSANLNNTIMWYLSGAISPDYGCPAPQKTIFYTFDRRIYPCSGKIRFWNPGKSDFSYTEGDIKNPDSIYNKKIKALSTYCRKECSLTSCYL